MGPTGATNAASAAFSGGWLRPGSRAHRGAVTAAPVPCGLIQSVQNRRARGRGAPAVPSRSRGDGGIAPARGIAVGFLLSGPIWAVLVAAVRTLLWG
jgi:hypothetical protein